MATLHTPHTSHIFSFRLIYYCVIEKFLNALLPLRKLPAANPAPSSPLSYSPSPPCCSTHTSRKPQAAKDSAAATTTTTAMANGKEQNKRKKKKRTEEQRTTATTTREQQTKTEPIRCDTKLVLATHTHIQKVHAMQVCVYVWGRMCGCVQRELVQHDVVVDVDANAACTLGWPWQLLQLLLLPVVVVLATACWGSNCLRNDLHW